MLNPVVAWLSGRCLCGDHRGGHFGEPDAAHEPAGGAQRRGDHRAGHCRRHQAGVHQTRYMSNTVRTLSRLESRSSSI